MLLNQTAEYALRAMTVLAEADGHERLSTAEIGRLAQVPPSYLSKVLRRLVVAGLVDARRGHKGGFRLALPAAEITFMAVLEAVDQAPIPGRCAFGTGRCNPKAPCVLHASTTDLNERFEQWARQTTLAIVVGDQDDA